MPELHPFLAQAEKSLLHRVHDLAAQHYEELARRMRSNGDLR